MTGPSTPIDVAQLVTDYHAAVYRYAYRLTGSSVEAEDLTQQVFLIAVERIGQVRDRQRVRSWLFTVLRRCFLKQCRRPTVKTAASLEMEIEDIPDEVPDDAIDHERLQHALNQLPETYRVVVVMFYFEQCSYREIADTLELPLGTVMSRLSRAKGQLRRLLFEHDVPSAAPASSPGNHQ